MLTTTAPPSSRDQARMCAVTASPWAALSAARSGATPAAAAARMRSPTRGDCPLPARSGVAGRARATRARERRVRAPRPWSTGASGRGGHRREAVELAGERPQRLRARGDRLVGGQRRDRRRRGSPPAASRLGCGGRARAPGGTRCRAPPPVPPARRPWPASRDSRPPPPAAIDAACPCLARNRFFPGGQLNTGASGATSPPPRQPYRPLIAALPGGRQVRALPTSFQRPGTTRAARASLIASPIR